MISRRAEPFEVAGEDALDAAQALQVGRLRAHGEPVGPRAQRGAAPRVEGHDDLVVGALDVQVHLAMNQWTAAVRRPWIRGRGSAVQTSRAVGVPMGSHRMQRRTSAGAAANSSSTTARGSRKCLQPS